VQAPVLGLVLNAVKAQSLGYYDYRPKKGR
jgi:hypothetical protein